MCRVFYLSAGNLMHITPREFWHKGRAKIVRIEGLTPIRSTIRKPSSRVSLYAAESNVVLDLALGTNEETGAKLQNHEHLFGHVVFTADAIAGR